MLIKLKSKMNEFLPVCLMVSLVFSFLTFAVGTAFAGIGVSPAKIELVLTESSKDIPITFKNTGDTAVQVKIYVEGLTQTLERGIDFAPNTGGVFSGISNIELNPKEFTVEGGKEQIVRATFNKPEGNSGGGLYAVIFFESKVDKSSDLSTGGNAGVDAVSRIGIISEMTIPGETIKTAKVDKVYVAQRSANAPIEFFSAVENTGNIHFLPSGFIKIKDSSGNLLGNIPVEPAKIFPGGVRDLRAIWETTSLSAGEYTIESEIEGTSASGKFSVIAQNEVAVKRGEILNFRAPVAAKKQPFDINFLVHNSGNINLDAEAKIDFVDENEKIVGTIMLPLSVVIPNENTAFKGTYKEGLPVGRYIANATVDYGGQTKALADVNFDVLEKIAIIKGLISEFSISSVKSGGNLSPKFSIKNQGNVPFSTEGIIEIKTGSGATAGQMAIPQAVIAAGKEQVFSISWKANLPAGLYKANAMISYADGKVLTKETSFFVSK
ncbi:hypothetical protein A2310_02180 [candidate division WOR-1 bacterium RIFOXYB2_FULL_37_13]|uniref:CARDB domain-containing protein n=1 Tax=candidate division WOR-1 bacterium RIFOXYB2_FULL_37_13 TaxID=1802579 RepID=A0A1F4SMA7_UNCSA|nr:MAG: hypothetical protein A2310_02180 [candidate division WOR-1 bacterium RIFOXYB2_FULL_37_13]